MLSVEAWIAISSSCQSRFGLRNAPKLPPDRPAGLIKASREQVHRAMDLCVIARRHLMRPPSS